MTKHYLAMTEIGERLGISPTTVRSYFDAGRLPEPDVTVGRVRGWSPETIDKWQQNRPGRGYRTDLARNAGLGQKPGI